MNIFLPSSPTLLVPKTHLRAGTLLPTLGEGRQALSYVLLEDFYPLLMLGEGARNERVRVEKWFASQNVPDDLKSDFRVSQKVSPI